MLMRFIYSDSDKLEKTSIIIKLIRDGGMSRWSCLLPNKEASDSLLVPEGVFPVNENTCDVDSQSSEETC